MKKNFLQIFFFFKMSLRDRYMGSRLGMFWGVLNPLVMLGMYTFIFGYVYTAKVPGAETTLAYATWLISGLVPYLAFNDGVMATANAVLAAANIVKNTQVRAENLVFAAALTSLVPLAVGLCFLILVRACDGALPTWHTVLLLPMLGAQLLLLCGVGLFLAPLTLFVRDLQQVLPTVLMLLMFATPIFYTVEMMPAILGKISFFNPLYQIAEPYRAIILHGQVPDWKGFCYLLAVGVCLNTTGLWFFRKLREYFEVAL